MLLTSFIEYLNKLLIKTSPGPDLFEVGVLYFKNNFSSSFLESYKKIISYICMSANKGGTLECHRLDNGLKVVKGQLGEAELGPKLFRICKQDGKSL